MESVYDVLTDMQQLRVTMRGDTAWKTFYWIDSVIDNGKVFSSRGKSTRIIVKDNDRWLCIHSHHTISA
ncbi:hypothetical protein ACFL47_00910 [Candidatus Latescibacterota bacterium]